MWATVRSLATRAAHRSLLAPMLLAGCAAGPEPSIPLSGTSGPVSWEVVNVSQTSVPGEEIRWQYTLILRSETVTIQFATVETGSEGGGEGIHAQPFTELLEAHGRLVLNAAYGLQQNKMNSERFGNSTLGRHLEGVRLFHRFTGKDPDGRPVRIDIRFMLRPGLGAQSPRSPSRGEIDRATDFRRAHRLAPRESVIEPSLVAGLQ